MYNQQYYINDNRGFVMNRQLKRAVSVFMILIIVLSFTSTSYAQGNLSITSKGACVMDFDTGEMLYGYNEDIPRVPASLTKLATLYCVYKAMGEGQFSLSDNVPISSDMQNKSINGFYEDYFPLYSDVNYTVDDLINATFVRSSNCAAVRLAILVGGTEENFMNIMRDTLSELGIKAELYDCIGLNNNNKIAPFELLKLVRTFISQYPEILEKTSMTYLDFHGKRYKSTNLLLDKYYYDGADGLKTGTTKAAGYCFCATAKRGDRRLISVTMFSKSGDERFYDSIKMLDYGFDIISKQSGIFYSDIKVFFDEIEIPSYHLKNKSSYILVNANDLTNCGFDQRYLEEERTLYLIYNLEKDKLLKDIIPFNAGEKISDVSDTDIKVIVTINGENSYINDSFNLNGDMLVSIDELSKYFNYSWDIDNRFALFSSH